MGFLTPMPFLGITPDHDLGRTEHKKKKYFMACNGETVLNPARSMSFKSRSGNTMNHAVRGFEDLDVH